MKTEKTNNLEPLDEENSGLKSLKWGGENSSILYLDKKNYKPIDYSVGYFGHGKGYGSPLQTYPLEEQFFRFMIADRFISSKTTTQIEGLEISYIEEKHLIERENNFDKNNFVKYLYAHYCKDEVEEAIKKYRIGTSDYWNGATLFWNLDRQNRICSGRVIHFDKKTRNRTITKGIPEIKSMKSILRNKGHIDKTFIQLNSLFGEHLLIDKEKIIGLVESEETAVIASMFLKNHIWLATGKRNFLTKECLKALEGRDVILYPDNHSFYDWLEIGLKYKFRTSTMVKEYSTMENVNLADYLEKLHTNALAKDNLPF